MEINKEDGQSASEWALPVGLTREWPQSPLTLPATWARVALLYQTEPSDSDSAQRAVVSENGSNLPKKGGSGFKSGAHKFGPLTPTPYPYP